MKMLHKKVVQKWGVLAVAITALSLPTIAKAADDLLPKDGVSLDELKSIVPDLEVLRDGRKIELEGSVPARCIVQQGKNVSNISYEFRDGKHLITVRLAKECENGFKEENGEKRVSLSSALNKPILLKDETGPVRMKYLRAGPPRSKDRVQDKDALLVDAQGKEINVLGASDRQIEADKKKHEDDKAAIDQLAKKIDSLCKKNDFESISLALESAKDVLGDVTELLGGLTKIEQESFKAHLSDAVSSAKAKEIRDAFIEQAQAKGLEEDALDKAYIEKRFALITKMIEDNKSDKEVTAAIVDKEIVAWQREFRDMDRATYKKNVKQFASAYADLAVNEYNAGKSAKNLSRLENSERMYLKGMDFVSDKVEWQKQLAKVNNQAFKLCVDKNPENMSKCESKFADKGKEYADQVKDSLSGNTDTEDGALAYAQFMQEYGSTYGEGPVQYTPMGAMHPYAPGAVDLYKQQALQNYYMNMQQKLMQGQGGMMGRARNSLF